MPGRKPAWNVLSLCIETSKAQKRSVVHISKYGILNVKNPLGVVSYNKIKGEIDAALASHLSIFPHARRLPAYSTAAAKLQNSMGENCANRFFGLSFVPPVQIRFRSPAARMPHVVFSYLPSVARKYTLAVLGAVPRCDPGRAATRI